MEDPIALKKAFRFSVWFSIILALVLLIIVSDRFHSLYA